MSNDTIPVPQYACEEHGEAFYTSRLLQSHNYQFHSTFYLPDDLADAAYRAREGLMDILAGKCTPQQAEQIVRDLGEYVDNLKEELGI